MNNNAKRITRATAEYIYEYFQIIFEDPSSSKEIMRGGGSNGGAITKALNIRQIEDVRISIDAFKICREKNVNIIDYFLLGRDSSSLKRKYGKFFSSNEKTVEKCHSVGQYLTFDHNIPNRYLIKNIYDLIDRYKDKSKEFVVKKIITMLNKQSLDIITIEENCKLKEAGLNCEGSKEERDSLCSKKINLKDIWLTPEHIIKQFFETSGLNKEDCLDPCACDGRWLKGKGLSGDILPMSDFVAEVDFLKVEQIPGVKHIVGNIPFSLTKEFVEKAFELKGEAYFLVNGDTIMNQFNGHIKKLWIINGIEGNQKDFRSRCEFDTIILKKSALWCCIVHLTKEKQKEFIIEKDITNEEKRDGYHIALGRNTYIKSDIPVLENERIIRLQTKGTIKYK